MRSRKRLSTSARSSETGLAEISHRPPARTRRKSPAPPPPRRRIVPAHEVGVHDPAVRPPGFGPDPLDVVNDILELAREQDFIGRADIGTPEDVHILVGKAPVGVLGVEHDDDAVDIVRKSLGEAASRRDLEVTQSEFAAELLPLLSASQRSSNASASAPKRVSNTRAERMRSTRKCRKSFRNSHQAAITVTST